MKEEIPYMTSETATAPKSEPFPIANLIPEIVSRANMEAAFDYVVSHLESQEQRDQERPNKKSYVDKLIKEIGDGSFRITKKDFRTLEVKDGPKARIVQCPTVCHRVGVHGIMVPFEAHTYPSLITNTGASIKGRGMHWLFHRIEEDFAHVPELMQFFYMCDIEHFYDNIVQRILESQIREYTSDPILLPILDNFVEMLNQVPELARKNEDGYFIGISKGLRSSQCFANLHLSPADHLMCDTVKHYTVEDEGKEKEVFVGIGEKFIDGKEVRYLYYRYCDDIRIYSATKKECWAARNILYDALATLQLHIKPNEAVRPISEGDDFLGFFNFFTHARIRKRTKQKFARHLKKVKSRKRRKKLIGSFFGMAAHCDCRHLLKKLIAPSEYKRLKHKRKMKNFGDFKIEPTTLDGKKNFRGNKVSPRELDRQSFIVVDFEKDVVARRDRDDYNRRVQDASARGVDPSLVEKPKTKYILQIIHNGQLRKLWTGDRDIWSILDQIDEEDGFPFFVAIEMDYSGGQYPKANFVSPSKFGAIKPTDEEVDALLRQFNLK